MGYEIVYCASCQSQVRGADLEKRLAIRVNDQAYCAKCASAVLKELPSERVGEILGRVPSPPPVRKVSSSHIPALQSKSSVRIKAQPPAAPPPRGPIVLACAAGGVAGLVALVVILTSSRGSAPEQGKGMESPKPPTTRPRSGDDAAAAALAGLEQLAAASTDPLEILTRCDQIEDRVRGTPHEARWKAIRERATETQKLRDTDRAITLGLEQVRSLRKFDLRFERRSEVESLLGRMKAMGGPRQGDVQAVADEYAKEVAEAALRFKDLAAWYRFSAGDRLGVDDSGHGNHAASTEGVAWNGSEADRGSGARFLGKTGLAIPASVREDLTIALWVRTSQPPVPGDQWWQGIGLVDGEVPGEVEDFGTSILRGKFAFGVGKLDTTLLSRTEISDGRWHHVAATRDSRSGEMKVYVDGTPEGSRSGPRGVRTAPPRLTLGILQTGYFPLAGDLDDVRLYARVLPMDEIASLARRRDGK